MKKTLLPMLMLLTSVCFAQRGKTVSVHFDLDRYNLTADATTVLDSFIAAKDAGTKIKLYGHTDIMAGYEYNDALSVKRTHAVKEYLVGKGFNPNDIIEEKGFGKRRPLNRNHGELEMYANRRVELIIPGEMNDEDEPVVSNEQTAVKPQSITQQLTDSQAVVGTNIELKSLHFYGGTHIIIPQSLPVLIELADVMKKNPTLEIAVEGHICCQKDTGDGFDIGTRTFNLSENRAREICSYLNQNGILASRLQYKGFGHQTPINPYPEKTEAERTKNRRVEIKIVKR